jgi:hypothetical protein
MIVETREFLTSKYGDAVTITNEPIEVGKEETKPYDVSINGTLIYSPVTPVNGEKGPINLSANKWWGEPDQAKIDLITNSIDAAAK